MSEIVRTICAALGRREPRLALPVSPVSMITIKEPAIFAVMEPVQNAQKAVSDDPIN
jgi:hypothetical protein